MKTGKAGGVDVAAGPGPVREACSRDKGQCGRLAAGTGKAEAEEQLGDVGGWALMLRQGRGRQRRRKSSATWALMLRQGRGRQGRRRSSATCSAFLPRERRQKKGMGGEESGRFAFVPDLAHRFRLSPPASLPVSRVFFIFPLLSQFPVGKTIQRAFRPAAARVLARKKKAGRLIAPSA